jgi:hypothetical protein
MSTPAAATPPAGASRSTTRFPAASSAQSTNRSSAPAAARRRRLATVSSAASQSRARKSLTSHTTFATPDSASRMSAVVARDCRGPALRLEAVSRSSSPRAAATVCGVAACRGIPNAAAGLAASAENVPAMNSCRPPAAASSVSTRSATPRARSKAAVAPIRPAVETSAIE